MADPFFQSQETLARALFRNVANVADMKKFISAASLPFCILKPKYVSIGCVTKLSLHSYNDVDTQNTFDR